MKIDIQVNGGSGLLFNDVKNLDEFLNIVLILLPMLNPFITSNPENKSLVTEVISSKLCEQLFFSTINFLERTLGITNPSIPNMTINITIAGLIQNKNKSEIIKDITGENPVALLDDVMSELDEKRQDYVLNHIKERQVFLTCCDPSQVLRLCKGKSFLIDSGSIKEEK